MPGGDKRTGKVKSDAVYTMGDGFMTMISILSGYLIQCNDETGNPFNDLNRGSKVSHLLEGRFIVEMCLWAQEKRLRRDARIQFGSYAVEVNSDPEWRNRRRSSQHQACELSSLILFLRYTVGVT